MTALAKPRMTVGDFLSWVEGKPGRYELFRGEVYAMSPETVGHASTKGAVYLALSNAIRQGRLPCHALPDGATIRIDDTTAYEPDALVYCGERLPASAIEIPNPVVIVEVLSPSTRGVDLSLKLIGYFRLPSVAHYLIVDPTRAEVIHHARGSGDTILTRIVTDGTIALDPPGLTLALADIYDEIRR
jgi:Uma2 family endonuclease